MYTTICKESRQHDEPELISEILAGNTALFEILIRKYNPILYKTARGYGFNHEDAEDLMQDTFINSFQGLSGFEHRSSFKTWLVKIMLNNCYHKYQEHNVQRKRSIEMMNEAKTTVYPNQNHHVTDNSVINNELSNVIESKLHKLPNHYRMTFIMRELNGLNIIETATALNITTTNVKVRLNRAKAMLQKEIKTVYSAEDIFEFNLIYCDKIVEVVMGRVI
jgi:RNA polymerase sigma-70 factor (ECF subfamily)